MGENEGSELRITGLNAKAIECRVVEEMVRLLHHDTKSVVEEEVKKVITAEIRGAISKQVKTIVEDLKFGENGEYGFADYVRSRVEGKRDPSGIWTKPIRIQEMVDRLIYGESERWFREFVDPHMAKIKEGIRSQLLDRILRESTYDDGKKS